jgi:2-desacetyl-2-hydroxyethyl bacteriochlorophyllide A dehydrogenase
MKRRVLYFEEPYRVAAREEPIAPLADDAVLVATIVSAISAGTELLFYRGQVPAHMSVDANIHALAGTVTYPLAYGYACVGRVVELGARVSPEWRDRLVFAFQPHASHFICATDELMPLPEKIAPEVAAFLPNMETAVNFVMDGAPRLGENVCVLGQGVVGLLTTALLAHMPLARLIAFDHFPMRRALALELGAHAAFDSTAQDAIAHARAMFQHDGADLTYELSGNPDALNAAIALTGFSGRVVIGSWYGEKRAPLDLGGTFHRSRIRLLSSQVSTLAPELTGRWTKARRMDVAWQMLARVNVARLITHRVPLEQAATAYTMLDTQPQETLQVLLTY